MKFPRPDAVVAVLDQLIEKFVDRTLTTKKECKEIIPTANSLTDVRAMCNFFDSIANAENGLDVKEEVDAYLELVQKYFIFAMIWSIGGTIDEESRKKLDMLFRELEPAFPSKDTVYEYFIEPKSRTWKYWEERVPQNWKPSEDIPMYSSCLRLTLHVTSSSSMRW
jgi:dynein heavy chain, axonemal